MSYQFKKTFSFILGVKEEDLLKVILLSITFFLVIAAYTIVRELKDIIFTSIVGCDRTFISYAKLFSMFVLVPTLLLHSKIVDTLRMQYLLCFYCTIYGILGLIFAFLLGNSVIGLPNAIPGGNRLLGWLFYFFIEGYSPLVVSVFWAFANSVTEPKEAKSNYTAMIAASKLGGIISAGLGCMLLSANLFSEVVSHQVLLVVSSILLLIVPLVIYVLISKVPKSDMHGYEAVYRVEKERSKNPKEDKQESGILSGLFMLFKYPYVMGIFGLSFFFELVNQTIKVENIVFVRRACPTISDSTYTLLYQAMLVHVVGFIVVVFGTRALIQMLGEKWALVLVPVVTGLSVIGFVLDPSYYTAVIAFVVIRSVNYALAVPLRESLYIPTVKAIKFKTKSWIDGIGNKFAKAAASTFTANVDKLAAPTLFFVQSAFFSSIISVWMVTAYFLGKRFEQAVKKNEAIGADLDAA